MSSGGGNVGVDYVNRCSGNRKSVCAGDIDGGILKVESSSALRTKQESRSAGGINCRVADSKDRIVAGLQICAPIGGSGDIPLNVIEHKRTCPVVKGVTAARGGYGELIIFLTDEFNGTASKT